MPTGRLDEVRLHLVENMDDVRAFNDWLRRPRRMLGVDTETTGLSPENGSVRLIQFGDLKDGWSIDWEMWRGVAVEALDHYDGPLVLHNC